MRKSILSSFVLLTLIPITASADNTAAVKSQIDASFGAMMSAFKKHDLPGIMAACTDDYHGVDETGAKVNRAQMADHMRLALQMTKKVNHAAYVVSGLKVNGASATGKTLFNLDAQIIDASGMMGPKGKLHRMTMVQVNNVTWVKKGSRWLVSVESSAAPTKMSFDGKPFSPMAPPPAKK